MTNADARFQNRVLIRMYDDVILYVAERANMDSAEVGTQNRAEPNACMLPNFNISQQYSGRGDECARVNSRPFALKLD